MIELLTCLVKTGWRVTRQTVKIKGCTMRGPWSAHQAHSRNRGDTVESKLNSEVTFHLQVIHEQLEGRMKVILNLNWQRNYGHLCYWQNQERDWRIWSDNNQTYSIKIKYRHVDHNYLAPAMRHHQEKLPQNQGCQNWVFRNFEVISQVGVYFLGIVSISYSWEY